jgi:hypothetical protein
MAGLVPAIHVLRVRGAKDVDARHKAGHDETGGLYRWESENYALAISGKTASILVFSVAALNGLTM